MEECSKILTVQNKMGVHTRPAAMIVRVATKYRSLEIFVEKDDESVNCKSILGLMMLAAGNGSKMKFIVQGDDLSESENFFNDLEELFNNKFNEE